MPEMKMTLIYKVCLNSKDDSHDSEKPMRRTLVMLVIQGQSQSQGDVNKHEINYGNNDV